MTEVAGFHLSDAGDIVGPVDPLTFGWTSNNAGEGVADDRRDLNAVEQLRGFSLLVTDYESFAPGPREGRRSWRQWQPGHAPPVAVMSQHGYEHPESSTTVSRSRSGGPLANLPTAYASCRPAIHDSSRALFSSAG